MGTTPVRALALHTHYRCRHSGVCCSAGWDIPVEVGVHRTIASGLAAGSLSHSPVVAEPLPFRDGLPADYASVLATHADGTCVFLDRDTHRCRVHATLGAGAKPISCRAFPLISVRDPRGLQVSLSHYCPSAADSLFGPDAGLDGADPSGDDPANEMVCVDAAATFGADEEALEGLDARAALPPLLRDDMLLDWDTLTTWEQFAMGAFNSSAWPEVALARLSDGYRALCAWTPRRGPLAHHARALVEGPLPVEPAPARSRDVDTDRQSELVAAVRGAIPAPLRPAAPAAGLLSDRTRAALVAPAWSACSRALRRYLAARSVACWPLHQGRGLGTLLRYLDAVLAVVRWQAVEQSTPGGPALDRRHIREAIRRADLLLVHLTMPDALALALDRDAERPVSR